MNLRKSFRLQCTLFLKCSLIALLSFSSATMYAQLDWARVTTVCPCTLESQDGQTVTVRFGLKNFEDYPIENLYVTISASGNFQGEEFENEKFLLLGTAPLQFGLAALEERAAGTYEVELGQLPEGSGFLELIIHQGLTLDGVSLLDTVWFEDETVMPFTSLSKSEMDFLRDTDGDGVGDLNESLVGTDPADAMEVPNAPQIDVLVVYDTDIQAAFFGQEPTLITSHIFEVTNFLYKRSSVPLHFRLVGMLDESVVPFVASGEYFLPDELRDQLREDYGADLVVVFQRATFGACGIAESISGWRGRGFIHPNEQGVLTHVWLGRCPISVTAHEIGHLLGLGHSYEQTAIGAFYWSRGHGVRNEFGTLMTYAKPAFNAIDIDKFSDPHADCNGRPCGISHLLTNHEKAADSVRSLNITKYQVAAIGTPPSDLDVDGDGFAADTDQFPLDPEEWADTDGDGYGDNQDQFPNLATEWSDTDGDGIGDNSDPDIDGDGVLDKDDAAPFDPNVSTARIAYLVSEFLDDLFGLEAVRTGDWNNDDLDDLAIAAPKTTDNNGDAVGAVYLISMAVFSQEQADTGRDGSRLELGHFLEQGHAWMIQGTDDGSDLGAHMTYLTETGEDASNGILLVSSTRGVHLIRLDPSTLASLDEVDGTEDHRLALENCDPSHGCWFVSESNDFELHGVTSMHDRDRDEIADFAVLGSRRDADTANTVNLYLLTTSAVQTAATTMMHAENTFDNIVADCSACYQIEIDTTIDRLSLFDLGDLTGYLGHELGVGIRGCPFPRGPGVDILKELERCPLEVEGTAYILNTDLIALFDTIDGETDRNVKVDALLGEDYGSYKILMPQIPAFGRQIATVANIDDDRPAVMLWNQFGPHTLATTEGLAQLDAADDSVDGNIVLQHDSATLSGVWYVSNLTSEHERSQAILNPPSRTQGSILLYQDRTDAVMLEFNATGFSGTPGGNPDEEEDLPYFINDMAFAVPQGLRPGTDLSGMLSLGDLDGDGQLDFLFGAHTQNADRNTTSVVHVIYSESLPTLDTADGSRDRYILLHNNLDDIDGDGVANLFDDDDDNDGAVDSYDRYPLHANAIYDSDNDGTANVVDQFPEDRNEHSDMDNDGIGDRFDRDTDGDGVQNDLDDFPFDTDNDGLDNYQDPDDDNDGVEDRLDAFPLDPTEQFDTDGDGYGDHVDLFVNDPNEWEDFDLDGIGNNADPDDDNDGYEDDNDHFPFNSAEWLDSDGDGIGDNADPFPDNPFEWEDANNDGLGDNLNSAPIATHRIESDWVDFDENVPFPLTSAFELGDFGLRGDSNLLIQGAIPHEPRLAMHLLSSSDLRQLDIYDQQADQTIQSRHIPDGVQSWELRASRSAFLSRYINSGAVMDIDRDGIGDLVIGGPGDASSAGVVYVVRGSQLSNADNIDGTLDSKINFTQCVNDGVCISIRSHSGTVSQLGVGLTTLNGSLYEGNATLVTASLTSAADSLEGDTSDRISIHLLPDTAITRELGTKQHGDVRLGQLFDQDDTIELYWELRADDKLVNDTRVHQLIDYDDDGMEDLLMTLGLLPDITLFVASGDILQADATDGKQDRRVKLNDIHHMPNSYQLRELEPTFVSARSTQWGNTSQQSRFVVFDAGLVEADQPPPDDDGFITISNLVELNFVDIFELMQHDASDGNTDGMITSIDAKETNALNVLGASNIEVCNDGSDNPNPYIVVNTFSGTSVYLLTLSVLQNTATASDTGENTLDFTNLFSVDTSDIWTVDLGRFAEGAFVQASCTGDWDGDGMQDFTISFLRTRIDLLLERAANLSSKATILVLMHADLTKLDQLDGSRDNVVDISLLWRDRSVDDRTTDPKSGK